MSELVTFPDVEALLVDWLDQRLDAPVSTGVPAKRPARFVTVTRTGGPLRDRAHDDATVVVQCWAKSGADAADLCSTTRMYLHALDERSAWFAGELGGPSWYPDPDTGLPRYQLTITVRLRGTA